MKGWVDGAGEWREAEGGERGAAGVQRTRGGSAIAVGRGRSRVHIFRGGIRLHVCAGIPVQRGELHGTREATLSARTLFTGSSQPTPKRCATRPELPTCKCESCGLWRP